MQILRQHLGVQKWKFDSNRPWSNDPNFAEMLARLTSAYPVILRRSLGSCFLIGEVIPEKPTASLLY